MKRYLLVVVLCAVATRGFLSSQDVSVSSPPASHIVVKGDTLWDISKKVYDNPYLWPSLWEVNKSTVSNPNLIYVGQSLTLPSKDEIKKIKPTSLPPQLVAPIASAKLKKTTAPSAPTITKAPLPPTPSYEESSASAPEPKNKSVAKPAEIAEQTEAKETTPLSEEPVSVSQISVEQPHAVAPSAKEDKKIPSVKPAPASPPSPTAAYPARIVSSGFTPDGIIVGMKEEKLLTSQGDIVYATFSFAKVSAGDRLGIYRRTGRKIYNPSDGRYIGDDLIRIGTAGVENVTPAEGGASSAIVRILVSREPVEKRDWLILEK